MKNEIFATGALLTLWTSVALGLASPAWAETAWPSMSHPPRHEGGGELDAAVVVGIEDYLMVPDIPGAVANAKAWYSWFTRTRGMPVGSVLILRDQEATREGMLSAARQMRDQVQPGGTLWFVFIGHGAPTKDGRDGVLVGIDTQQTADSVYARGLIQGELIDELSQGRQSETLLVLDACFSGQSHGGEALVENLQPMIPSYAVESGEVTVLTAGKANQFAGPLPRADRPAFSYLLLGGLRGWADLDRDRNVTVEEAIAYTTDALRILIRGRAQEPVAAGSDGALVLSRGKERGPDLVAMVIDLEEDEEAESRSAVAVTGEQLGSDADLVALVDQSREAREAERALARALEEELSDAEEALRDAAERDWRTIASQLEPADEHSAELAQRYIDKYGEAAVTVHDETRRIEIARVRDARLVIGRATITASGSGRSLPSASEGALVRFHSNVPQTLVDVRGNGWTNAVSCRTPCRLKLEPGSYSMEFMHGRNYYSTRTSMGAGSWRVNATLVDQGGKKASLGVAMVNTFAFLGGICMIIGFGAEMNGDDFATYDAVQQAQVKHNIGVGVMVAGINLPLMILFTSLYTASSEVSVKRAPTKGGSP